LSIETDLKHASLTQFLEYIDQQNMFWIAKRLSGNDTGLTGGHQSGIYYPRSFFEQAFPALTTRTDSNQKDVVSHCYFPHADATVHDIAVTWYNNRLRGGTRNEFRITNWGGRRSPTNDVESTGAVFVFALIETERGHEAIGWVAATREEENLIETWLGEEVEPGEFYMPLPQPDTGLDSEIPVEWLEAFPTSKEIFAWISEQYPRAEWTSTLDKLLLKRREAEFALYRTLENRIVLPRILDGFDSVDTFIQYALSIANRRKSRTGKSLELNLEAIFKDEHLYFESQAMTENGKKPDFLFPSAMAYQDQAYPTNGLHLVAAKTTTKDRWRQVIDEAERIRIKHLFTLQQGVSPRQLQQMEASGIQLVVPAPYLTSYPPDWREKILTLEQLTDTIRQQQSSIRDIRRWRA